MTHSQNDDFSYIEPLSKRSKYDWKAMYKYYMAKKNRTLRITAWKFKIDPNYLSSGFLRRGLRKKHRTEIMPEGDEHYKWHGKFASKSSIKQALKLKGFKRPKICQICGEKLVTNMLNISGKYKRNIKDYVWACNGCKYYWDRGKLEKKILQKKVKK